MSEKVNVIKVEEKYTINTNNNKGEIRSLQATFIYNDAEEEWFLDSKERHYNNAELMELTIISTELNKKKSK